MPPFRGGAQLRLPGAGRSPGPQIAGSTAGGHAEGHPGSRNSRNLALSRHPPRRTLRAPGKGCAKPRGRDAFRIKGKRSKIRILVIACYRLVSTLRKRVTMVACQTSELLDTQGKRNIPAPFPPVKAMGSVRQASSLQKGGGPPSEPLLFSRDAAGSHRSRIKRSRTEQGSPAPEPCYRHKHLRRSKSRRSPEFFLCVYCATFHRATRAGLVFIERGCPSTPAALPS